MLAARRLGALYGQIRFASSGGRPELLTILPTKRSLNRFLFDFDSRLPYKKVLPILQTVYDNLDTPQDIKLPKSVRGSDLMIQKHILAAVRTKTNTMNRNLVELENELVEQAAELGDNDAITILAFEALESGNKEDFAYAQKLVKELVEKKHPLVFKLAGDVAFKKAQYHNAAEYWTQFLQYESDTVMASQVCSNLGVYYFSHLQPKPDLSKARQYFEQSVQIGELDKYTVIAHYYLGQLFSTTNPEVARYHLEIAASQALKESFATLGFLEMNTFNQYYKAIEWFQLGAEMSGDLMCIMGQFDCYVAVKDTTNAEKILDRLIGISDKIQEVRGKKMVPKSQEVRHTMELNESLLKMFFSTRAKDIAALENSE